MMEQLNTEASQNDGLLKQQEKVAGCAKELNDLFMKMADQKEELIRRLSSFEEVIDEIANYMSPLQIASFIILVEKVLEQVSAYIY